MISGMFDEMLSHGETVRVVGREGKQAAGLESHSTLTVSPLNQRRDSQPSSPPTSSPPCWLPLPGSQPLLSNQEPLGCFSQFPPVAVEAVLENLSCQQSGLFHQSLVESALPLGGRAQAAEAQARQPPPCSCQASPAPDLPPVST